MGRMMSDNQLDSKAPIAGKQLNPSDVEDLFKDETLDKKPVEKEELEELEEEPKKSKGDDTDDDNLELKEPEDEEEKLDLKSDDLNIDDIPRKKDILKKYPDLYKDFPFMEKMMYRDRQYNELFGSFDDAKALAESAEAFNGFQKDLASGNTEDILKSIKEEEPKAFDKIVDNYLVTLHNVDKDAYFEVIDRVNKTLIMEMAKEGKKSGNQEMQDAALLINQFLFGTSEFTPSKNRVSNDKPENDKLEQERLSYIKERFETSRDDLQGRVDNTLRATIAEYIDPKGAMSSYVKGKAVTDALNAIHDLVGKDSGTRSTLDKLWRAATDEKFSQDALRKIQSFYLGRCKPNLKNVILKIRAEALKDLAPKRAKENDDEEVEREPRRGKPIDTGKPPDQKNRGGMKKGESVADFFARD